MSRFKRAALAACLLLAVSSVLLAQGEPKPHPDGGGGRRGGSAPAARRDVATLVKALGGKSSYAAREAAGELAAAGAGAETVPAPAAALKSEQTQTRLYAALALATGDPKRAGALEVLQAVVRNRREYFLTRRYAAFALARTAAGVRALAAMLREEDVEVRLSSAFAFEDLSEGDSDDPAGPRAELVRVIPAIVAASRAERNGVVQTVLGETLGQLGPEGERHLLPDEDEGDAREAADAEEHDARPTPEEEREARNLALLFLARARLTGDLGFAARELLVEDFAGRLQRELVVGANFFDDFFDKRLAEQARPEELSRFYWSLLNFVSAGRTHLRVREDDEDKEREKDTLDEAFPPQVARVIERNDALAALVNKAWGITKMVEPEGDGAASPRAVRVSAGRPARAPAAGGRKEESPQKESDSLIRNVRELAAFTADAEEALKKLREHRAAHAETGAREAGAKGGRKSEGAEAEDTAGPPEVTILGDSYYGFPAKTRLICVDVTPAGGVATFHLDFVAVNGKLRLLTVTPQ